MQKFYYFLRDNPHYPEVIMANSKQEVVSLLVNDMGEHARESIFKVLTEEEFTGKKPTPAPQEQAEEGDFAVNAMNELANMQQQQLVQSIQPIQNVKIETKYFELNGEKLKLENNKLYKLEWFSIDNDQLSNYRIINSKTGKEIKNENYIIQKLDWNEVEN